MKQPIASADGLRVFGREVTVRKFDDVDQCRSLSEQALQSMIENGVPTNPENFEVWFHYSAGSDPELKKAIEQVKEQNGQINPEVIEEIREEFFAGKNTNDAVLDISSKMSGELNRVLEIVQSTGQDTSEFGTTLAGAADILGKSDAGDVRNMVEELVAATKKMEARSRVLEEELQKSTAEVNQLKENLETVTHEALTDELTSLANRKSFDKELRDAARNASNSGEPLCLIMSDIDHFKKFNDTWGHQTGDQVLRLVAHCLKVSVNEGQTPARYGGEEFGVILPATDIATASKIAEQIRSTVESKKVVKKTTGESLGTITLSLGISQLTQNDTLESLVKRADACLYAAKRSGRNCVKTEEEVDATTILEASA